MPFPTSTILLLCFFLACFVLSAHKPRPRVSVNSFQVPVSRHPAAPPLLATAAPALLPPGGLSSTSAHLLWGQPRAPQSGKSRPAGCCPHLSVCLSHEIKEIWVHREHPSHPRRGDVAMGQWARGGLGRATGEHVQHLTHCRLGVLGAQTSAPCSGQTCSQGSFSVFGQSSEEAEKQCQARK